VAVVVAEVVGTQLIPAQFQAHWVEQVEEDKAQDTLTVRDLLAELLVQPTPEVAAEVALRVMVETKMV
jgi:hypothetical protein